MMEKPTNTVQSAQSTRDKVRKPAADVFISYSHHDVLWAERIVGSLREHAKYPDLKVWVDGDIEKGANWEEEIFTALESTTIVLLLVSQAWVNSTYCGYEMERSLKLHGKCNGRLQWVSVDGTQPPKLLERQAAVPPSSPLNELKEFEAIEAKIRAICEVIFSQFDPMWSLLQAHLPAKYQLIRRLGVGSTSAVYLAGDRSLERRVAIRVVRDAVQNDAFDGAVHRAAQIVRHPVLPTVFGAWLHKHPHCCVLDYVEGRTLRLHLDETKSDSVRFDARDVVRILLRLGEALVQMHARGIQLRDLRPSKILLDHSGDAFIAGLSKPDNAIGAAILGRHGTSQRRATQEEVHYLVPEHFYPIGGDEPHDQSDQYLLGLIGYEMMLGELPATVSNWKKVGAGSLPQFIPLTPLHELPGKAAGCPRALSDLLARMTSVSPRDRFRHLSEVLGVLRDLQPIDLTLARESYARCTESRDFFGKFYRLLKEKVSEAEASFARVDQKKDGWQRLHRLLKEAILLLFAYAATPASARGEPNVLTRIAVFHGPCGDMPVKAIWYDQFVEALVEAVKAVDPVATGRSEGCIVQCWRSSLGPGIRYMKSHCDVASNEPKRVPQASGQMGEVH